MAHYTVTHSCGHTQRHNLGGKIALREQKLAWLATNLCETCYHAQQAEQYKIAAEEAHIAQRKAGLISLQGSEKQCAWANTIRMQHYDKIIQFLEYNPNCLLDITNREDAARLILNVVTTAKWWIDYRDAKVAAMVVQLIFREFKPQLREALSKYMENNE